MKIYLCTTASSKLYKSWSNIPYLLHNNLEKKGYVVINYVMRELEPCKTIFNAPLRILNKIFNLGITYFYVKTPLHFLFAKAYSHWIGLVSDKQDVMVIQGFSYPMHNGKNKQIIVGDWPSEYLFEKMLKRFPSRLERKSIDRENLVIEKADAVITLFPNVREYMLQKYSNKNIYCFGNFVNIDDEVVVPEDIFVRKRESHRLVFVGQPFYIRGALELIEAAHIVRQYGVSCEVDIVGIEKGLIGVEYDWLKIHGYLDKAIAKDKEKYYGLLANARLFVNTNPEWSGFQALLEAMYFHTPIVVRRNESLISYFQNLDELSYLPIGDHKGLAAVILESFSNQRTYQLKSENARRSVESSSWVEFTEQLIHLFQ